MSSAIERIRRHYEPPEGNTSPVATVKQILGSLPAASLNGAQLAGLDQFHVRGLAATVELAELAGIQPGMKIMDAGSGLGGSSRYLAGCCGCSVVGVDLTSSFVAVAKLLAQRTNLDHLVSYQVGDLTALSLADEQFDIVWTQHVVMNIPDRRQVYRELRRVLKPGGKLAFYDVIAADGEPEPYFPVPWAESSESSFLLTKANTIKALDSAGFFLSTWHDVTDEALAWFEQQRTGAQAPLTSPGLSLATVMGPRFAPMAANFARNVRDGRVRLAMAVAEAIR
jgi:SAM-dependent methyltransferase